jgi:hypothetical protein
VTTTSPDDYGRLADGAWRWVLEQVQWDDGPWIPESVASDADPARWALRA